MSRCTPAASGKRCSEAFDCVVSTRTPTYYRDLTIRAGFDTDPFKRTTLRKWAKAGWICRTLDEDGEELWSGK